MLESISHIALAVKDPARTAALFHDLFGTEAFERKDEEGHLETLLILGGISVVLVAAPVERTRSGDHIAFRVSARTLEATITRLQTLGREFITARSNTALYFFDDDNHVFELDAQDTDSARER